MRNTVKDLIEELNKIENKELEIHLEGCDCYQTWSGKVTLDDKNYLLLTNLNK